MKKSDKIFAYPAAIIGILALVYWIVGIGYMTEPSRRARSLGSRAVMVDYETGKRMSDPRGFYDIGVEKGVFTASCISIICFEEWGDNITPYDSWRRWFANSYARRTKEELQYYYSGFIKGYATRCPARRFFRSRCESKLQQMRSAYEKHFGALIENKYNK